MLRTLKANAIKKQIEKTAAALRILFLLTNMLTLLWEADSISKVMSKTEAMTANKRLKSQKLSGKVKTTSLLVY